MSWHLKDRELEHRTDWIERYRSICGNRASLASAALFSPLYRLHRTPAVGGSLFASTDHTCGSPVSLTGKEHTLPKPAHERDGEGFKRIAWMLRPPPAWKPGVCGDSLVLRGSREVFAHLLRTTR